MADRQRTPKMLIFATRLEITQEDGAICVVWHAITIPAEEETIGGFRTRADGNEWIGADLPRNSGLRSGHPLRCGGRSRDSGVVDCPPGKTWIQQPVECGLAWQTERIDGAYGSGQKSDEK